MRLFRVWQVSLIGKLLFDRTVEINLSHSRRSYV
jgi:hypothetical protein